MNLVIILVTASAVLIAGAGFYFALLSMGFFQYMGGKRTNPQAVKKEILINRLLSLSDPAQPYHIIPGQDCDLIAEWKLADATWYGILNKNQLKIAYRVNLLVDEPRHSVRCYERYTSVSWSAGMQGPVPGFNFTKSFFGGRIFFKKSWGVVYAIKDVKTMEAGKVYEYHFDIDKIRKPIIDMVEKSGWEWIPATALRHAVRQWPPRDD